MRDTVRSLREIMREAERMGFTAELTKGGHIKFVRRNPDAVVYTTSTPADRWTITKIFQDLRRASDPNNSFGKARHANGK